MPRKKASNVVNDVNVSAVRSALKGVDFCGGERGLIIIELAKIYNPECFLAKEDLLELLKFFGAKIDEDSKECDLSSLNWDFLGYITALNSKKGAPDLAELEDFCALFVKDFGVIDNSIKINSFNKELLTHIIAIQGGLGLVSSTDLRNFLEKFCIIESENGGFCQYSYESRELFPAQKIFLENFKKISGKKGIPGSQKGLDFFTSMFGKMVDEKTGQGIVLRGYEVTFLKEIANLQQQKGIDYIDGLGSIFALFGIFKDEKRGRLDFLGYDNDNKKLFRAFLDMHSNKRGMNSLRHSVSETKGLIESLALFCNASRVEINDRASKFSCENFNWDLFEAIRKIRQGCGTPGVEEVGSFLSIFATKSLKNSEALVLNERSMSIIKWVSFICRQRNFAKEADVRRLLAMFGAQNTPFGFDFSDFKMDLFKSTAKMLNGRQISGDNLEKLEGLFDLFGVKRGTVGAFSFTDLQLKWCKAVFDTRNFSGMPSVDKVKAFMAAFGVKCDESGVFILDEQNGQKLVDDIKAVKKSVLDINALEFFLMVAQNKSLSQDLGEVSKDDFEALVVSYSGYCPFRNLSHENFALLRKAINMINCDKKKLSDINLETLLLLCGGIFVQEEPLIIDLKKLDNELLEAVVLMQKSRGFFEKKDIEILLYLCNAFAEDGSLNIFDEKFDRRLFLAILKALEGLGLDKFDANFDRFCAEQNTKKEIFAVSLRKSQFARDSLLSFIKKKKAHSRKRKRADLTPVEVEEVNNPKKRKREEEGGDKDYAQLLEKFEEEVKKKVASKKMQAGRKGKKAKTMAVFGRHMASDLESRGSHGTSIVDLCTEAGSEAVNRDLYDFFVEASKRCSLRDLGVALIELFKFDDGSAVGGLKINNFDLYCSNLEVILMMTMNKPKNIVLIPEIAKYFDKYEGENDIAKLDAIFKEYEKHYTENVIKFISGDKVKEEEAQKIFCDTATIDSLLIFLRSKWAEKVEIVEVSEGEIDQYLQERREQREEEERKSREKKEFYKFRRKLERERGATSRVTIDEQGNLVMESEDEAPSQSPSPTGELAGDEVEDLGLY